MRDMGNTTFCLTPPRTHERHLAAKDSSPLKCGQTQYGCKTRVVVVGPKNDRVGGHYITDVWRSNVIGPCWMIFLKHFFTPKLFVYALPQRGQKSSIFWEETGKRYGGSTSRKKELWVRQFSCGKTNCVRLRRIHVWHFKNSWHGNNIVLVIARHSWNWYAQPCWTHFLTKSFT